MCTLLFLQTQGSTTYPVILNEVKDLIEILRSTQNDRRVVVFRCVCGRVSAKLLQKTLVNEPEAQYASTDHMIHFAKGFDLISPA